MNKSNRNSVFTVSTPLQPINKLWLKYVTRNWNFIQKLVSKSNFQLFTLFFQLSRKLVRNGHRNEYSKKNSLTENIEQMIDFCRFVVFFALLFFSLVVRIRFFLAIAVAVFECYEGDVDEFRMAVIATTLHSTCSIDKRMTSERIQKIINQPTIRTYCWNESL